MNDTHAVGCAQSFEDVGRVAQCLRNRERALGIQECAQVGPIDELHDEEALARDDSLVEDGDDARVDNAGGGARLSVETLDEGIGFSEVGVHDL